LFYGIIDLIRAIYGLKMAKSSTSFGKKNQPTKRRGKSERTKILEAMKRVGKTENGFYDELVNRAHNPEDNFSYKELLIRLSPIPKAVAPSITFDFDENAPMHEQSSQVLKAISKGDIPPDIGQGIISSIASMIKIKEVTDIDERLKEMEKHLESPE